MTPAADSSLLQVVLVEPQIPPNTGNVARLCAANGVPLHLVGRLGFRLTDRQLKRAGLDYWPYVTLERHVSLEAFLEGRDPTTLHFLSSKAPLPYTLVPYRRGDALVFGSETRGLPSWLWEKYGERFRAIPMADPRIRSLNLASAVAVVLYEALRQLNADWKAWSPQARI